MHEDDLRTLQIQLLDLDNKVKKLGILNKIWNIIVSKKYETVLFLLLLTSIIISNLILNNSIQKSIISSSIRSSNSIKKQIKEYYDIVPSP